jgi:hypothetical protein
MTEGGYELRVLYRHISIIFLQVFDIGCHDWPCSLNQFHTFHSAEIDERALREKEQSAIIS